MKPIRPLQDLFPVYHSFLDGGDRGACPVIYDFAWSRHRSGLKEINPQTVSTINNSGSIHSIRTQVLHACSGNIIVRKPCDKLCIHSIIGKRHRHIGFAATESGIILSGLPESQVSRSGKSEHDLSESYYPWHICDWFCNWFLRKYSKKINRQVHKKEVG